MNAEAVWYEIRGHGARYGLRVIAPAHHRRNAAGILSWGQDMDAETSPFQVKLAHQVPRKKEADNVGKGALEAERDAIDAGWPSFRLTLVGLKMGGKPITDYAPDFWLIDMPDRDHVGYVMSLWWLPELDSNIALGYVPWEMQEIGTPFMVELPPAYTEFSGRSVAAEVCEVPFRASAHLTSGKRTRAAGRDWAV